VRASTLLGHLLISERRLIYDQDVSVRIGRISTRIIVFMTLTPTVIRDALAVAVARAILGAKVDAEGEQAGKRPSSAASMVGISSDVRNSKGRFFT
jgi:hypothetical protein